MPLLHGYNGKIVAVFVEAVWRLSGLPGQEHTWDSWARSRPQLFPSISNVALAVDRGGDRCGSSGWVWVGWAQGRAAG